MARAKVPSTPPETAPTAAPEETFEQLMARLEAIVAELEHGHLPLDDSVRKFEEGIALQRQIEARLDAAEHRIEVLMKGGEVRTITPSQLPEQGKLTLDPER